MKHQDKPKIKGIRISQKEHDELNKLLFERKKTWQNLILELLRSWAKKEKKK